MAYEFLLDFISESLNTDKSDLASVINEADPAASLAALKERDKARVAKLTESVTTKRDQLINQGFGDAMRKVKGYVKTKYNTDFDADNVEEVIDHVYSDVSTKAGKAGELDEEKLKLHPVFQAKEREFQKTLKQKEEEFNQKWTAKEQAEKRAATIGDVSSDAFKIIDDMKPVQYGKAAINERNRKDFKKEVIEAYDWEKDTSGTWMAFKDGKRVENAHGYPVPFDQLVKEHSNDYFEFPANNGGANAGNGKQQSGGTTGASNQAIKFNTEPEYQEIMSDKTGKYTPEQKRATYDVWSSQQPKN